MKCLRKAVNRTRRNKIRNEMIIDMAGAKPVLQHFKQQKTKWFGHITSMPINQPALWAYSTKYSGWRTRGRPRKRWSDYVADTIRTQGMSLLQATRLAADRHLYLPATPTGTSGRKKVKVKSLSVVFVRPAVLCGKNSNVGHYTQTFEPDLVKIVLLNTTIDFYHFKLVPVGDADEEETISSDLDIGWMSQGLIEVKPVLFLFSRTF